ncbi:hypothetical protein NDU88_002431 [Pleurodeles waltl]|nr:hypothetical protein NDU88_002416 [Pleurodeles waltl]KAJ1161951.1 hypothetical protein NDU88_002431 [Pleurodeles waltl]
MVKRQRYQTLQWQAHTPLLFASRTLRLETECTLITEDGLAASLHMVKRQRYQTLQWQAHTPLLFASRTLRLETGRGLMFNVRVPVS